MILMKTQLTACHVVCHLVLLNLRILFWKVRCYTLHHHYKAYGEKWRDYTFNFFLNYKGDTCLMQKTWKTEKGKGRHQRSIHNLTK